MFVQILSTDTIENIRNNSEENVYVQMLGL